MIRLGIDLGGTKIEILGLDENGLEIFRKRVITPKDNYSGILDHIKELIISAEAEIGQQGSIGICTPGAISPTSRLLRNSNSICLNNQPFKQDLENLLQREIRIANDANCFALSEAIDGSAADAATVFGVIIGTGCGAGIVINKQIIDGPNSIAGEWGHNSLPWPNKNELSDTQCWCGKKGCIETFLSGTGLSNDYKQRSGKTLTAQQIVTEASNNDSTAKDALSCYEERLAKSLASVINILDPHKIVLGGGMSNVKQLYTNIPKLWQNYVFSDTVLTELVAPMYGDSSGVRGAAWLWNH